MHKCRIRRSNSFFCPPCLLLGAKECGRVRRGGRERNCYLLAVAIDHGNCTIYLAMSLLCTNFPIFSAGGGQRQVLLALFTICTKFVIRRFICSSFASVVSLLHLNNSHLPAS